MSKKQQPEPLAVKLEPGTFVTPATKPPLEYAVSLRRLANGDMVAATLVIEGDCVISRDESKANFKAYATQQFKIRSGKLFAAIDKGDV